MLQGAKQIAEGDAKLSNPPLSKGTVELPLPDYASGKAEALRIDFTHPAGHHVVGHQFTLKDAPRAGRLDSKLPDGVPFPQFNLVTRKTERDPQVWRKVTRYPAKVSAKVDHLALDNRRDGGTPQTGANKLVVDVIGGPDGAVVGKLQAEYANNELKYRFEWTGPAKTEVQEIGWAFAMPKGFDQFSWDREARWTVYPDKHIGRPTGTATPDTMNVPYTKMERPDAYDFNSTKYDCNWASLTDASGSGLRVEFTDKQRFHCRGGVSADGKHVLFVNQQVSPPDDLSSNVVRDLYMTLNPGDVVEGSFRIGSNTK